LSPDFIILISRIPLKEIQGTVPILLEFVFFVFLSSFITKEDF